jgi:hypothetical protein
MCLIAFVPEGSAVPRAYFDYAHAVNNDGLGVMSVRDGVRKFYGRKQLKRARRYSASLSADGVAHAVHWRYTTHGETSLAMCHPFTTTDGRAHVMHNGVLWQYSQCAKGALSDTALYVAALRDVPEEAPGQESMLWGAVEKDIGSHNKFVVLHGSTFYILNEHMGEWLDGVWYSNTYSLPDGPDEDEALPQYVPGPADECSTLEDPCDWYDALAKTWVRAKRQHTGEYLEGRRYNPVTLGWDNPAERKRTYASGPTLETEESYYDQADAEFLAWYKDRHGIKTEE